MHNKVKRRGEVQQNLKIIIGQREKSQQERQILYTNNKRNFPPIIQSRQFILQRPQYKQNKSVSLDKFQIESGQEPLANYQQFTNRNTNIYRIQFRKQKTKRRVPANESNQGNIIQTISHSPRRYYLSQGKKKDLLSVNTSNNTKNSILQRFIQQLNIAKLNIKNSNAISKSQQYKSNLKGPSSIKPLLITKLANAPPSAYVQAPINQQCLLPNQQSQKYTLIKKADKFMFLKKRIVKKQGLFEPWQQQNFPEQQFLMQNKQ